MFTCNYVVTKAASILWMFTMFGFLHLLPAKQSLSMPSRDFVNCFSLEVVPSTIMYVVLFRQLLCTPLSLQRREIHAFSETVFNCSQNPLVGFFNVNFDFGMFFRMRL